MTHRQPLIRSCHALAWLLLFAVTWGLPAHSADDPTTFRVEMVIFRAATVAGVPEDWAIAPIPRGFGNIAGQGASPQLVQVLGANQYTLSGISARLRSSGTWHPVAHAAWIQTAANWGAHAGLSLDALGVHVAGLTGTVYFERGQQYPHLGFDIALGDYRIDEMRSIKYGDRQYFDHPAFGIIAVVTPVRASSSG